MINIISLDVGDKRVGVAIGTLKPKTFKPYATYQRANGSAEKKIISLIEENKVNQIVVGLPLNEDGSFSDQCLKIERFCHRIQRRCKVKIVFVDEYASSAEAHERISDLKKMSLVKSKHSKDKHGIDAMAASIILEYYLVSGSNIIREEEAAS